MGACSVVPNAGFGEIKKPHKTEAFCCSVRPKGFEPLTFCSVDRRSIQLSYGRLVFVSGAVRLTSNHYTDFRGGCKITFRIPGVSANFAFWK